MIQFNRNFHAKRRADRVNTALSSAGQLGCGRREAGCFGLLRSELLVAQKAQRPQRCDEGSRVFTPGPEVMGVVPRDGRTTGLVTDACVPDGEICESPFR